MTATTIRSSSNGRLGGVVFIGHWATRNGAPIMLLHFLRWFKQNGGRPFSILIDQAMGGALLGDYAEIADTWAADRSCWLPGGVRAQLLTAARMGFVARSAERSDVRAFARRCSPALIYANSVAEASARLIEMLDPNIPLITHVHELQLLLRMQGADRLGAILTRTSQFVACSEAVKQNLVANHGVTAERVETVHELIDTDGVRASRSRAEVLHELRIPGDSLVVVGSGMRDWRKGSDLFVQVARLVCARHPRAYFVWVGGGWAPWMDFQFDEDVRLAGVGERVRCTNIVTDPASYFAAADVFLLASREDPYPLVCLEAAALAKPIICFGGAGGMPEFVERDCGFVVPYLDVQTMTDRVVQLLEDSESRRRMGERARRKVAERHDVSVAAPKIAAVIERTIAGK